MGYFTLHQQHRYPSPKRNSLVLQYIFPDQRPQLLTKNDNLLHYGVGKVGTYATHVP